ncbi:MAG: superoxide dismutase [Simkaniaceae bacterium]
MKEQLPELPYAYDALEPVISKEIMELHHKKHHMGYVTKLNEALEKFEGAKDLETKIGSLQAIKFNGGGHLNHSLFWQNLAPVNKGGGELPKGPLKKAIEEQFGSIDDFIEKFSAMTAPIQGSGWGWLGYHPSSKSLVIHPMANQDPLHIIGLVPLLGVDVWEHAYYLQYKNARPEYIKNIWKIINWRTVEERYARVNQ